MNVSLPFNAYKRTFQQMKDTDNLTSNLTFFLCVGGLVGWLVGWVGIVIFSFLFPFTVIKESELKETKLLPKGEKPRVDC